MGIMSVEKFKPLDLNPFAAYDPRYWNIIWLDIFGVASVLFMGGLLLGRIPSAPKRRIIKFCGNPNCLSPFAFSTENKPSKCTVCGGIIDWDQVQTNKD